MAFSIDGSALKTAASTTTITATLSTSKTSDVIIIAVHAERGSTPHATVSSVADAAGLTWTKRSSVTLDSSTFNDGEVWYAISPGKLTSDVITVTFDRAADNCTVIAFGVNGADTTNKWDASGSLPATATSTSNSVPTVNGVSTTTANDMILGFGFWPSFTSMPAGTIGGASAVGIAGFGNSNTAVEAEYIIASGAVSSVSASFGSSVGAWLMIADALTPGHVPVVYNDSFTESVAASDSLANTMTMAATISESVAAHDSQTNGNVFNNAISEVMTATDSMAASVSSHGWSKQAPSGGTWTKVKPSSSGTWTKVNPSGGTWTKH